MDHTLEVVAEGGAVEYEFWSTGPVQANSDLNPNDQLDEKHVKGSCNGWHDSFDFNGAPMDFIVHSGFDNLKLLLDGQEVLPAHLKMNVAVVSSSDETRNAYGLSSSGKMIKRGLANSSERRVSDGYFEGIIKGGRDKFGFQGTLTGYWTNGDNVTLTVNGGQPRDMAGVPPAGVQS